MEVVRQDENFVRELLGRVLHLLYKTLQERASKMPNLVKDLGMPAGTELPVSLPCHSLRCHVQQSGSGRRFQRHHALCILKLCPWP